ncbi:hypothetical protein ACVU7I_09540, partial [Patulibacter sp. S7RM1-6]
ALAAAIAAAKRGGAALLVALPHAPAEIQPADIVDKSLTVVGTNGFDTHHLDDALAVLHAAPDALTEVVTHRVALEELPALLASPERARAMKILVDCR